MLTCVRASQLLVRQGKPVAVLRALPAECFRQCAAASGGSAGLGLKQSKQRYGNYETKWASLLLLQETYPRAYQRWTLSLGFK